MDNISEGRLIMKRISATGCGCLLLILAFNLTIGAWAFQYDFWAISGRHTSLPVDIIFGAILGEFTVTIALVMKILQITGTHLPLA